MQESPWASRTALHASSRSFTGHQIRQIGNHSGSKARAIADRYVLFLRAAPSCKQTFLGFFQIPRIEIAILSAVSTAVCASASVMSAAIKGCHRCR